MKHLLFIALLLLSFYSNAQFVQKEFIIGANFPPILTRESATPSPGDYNGDGKADLGSRINSGTNKGKFQIDYYCSSIPWFHKQGWDYITDSAIYGTTEDYMVSAD